MRAEHGLVTELAKQRQRLFERSAFLELAPLLDRQPSLLAQRLHRLGAAKVGARSDAGDLERSQEAGKTGSLAASLLVEWPQAVVSFPLPMLARAGMSDDEQRHRASAPGLTAGLPKLLERLGSLSPRAEHPLAPTLDQPSGNEPDFGVALRERELSQALVRDDGVLVLAEDVLDPLGASYEAPGPLAGGLLGQLACVACALATHADTVKLDIAWLRRQRLRRPFELLELPARELPRRAAQAVDSRALSFVAISRGRTGTVAGAWLRIHT